jgi:two-component system phosphate regulon sensor histidine kinase PhoR
MAQKSADKFAKYGNMKLNRYGIWLPLFVIGAVALTQFSTKSEFTGLLRGAWPIIIFLFAVTAIIGVKKNQKSKLADILVVTLVHLALAFELLFVADLASVYIFAWIFLLFDADRRLGKNANTISAFLLAIVMLLGPWSHLQPFTLAYALNKLASFAIIIILSQFTISAWRLNSEEQQALQTSYDQNLLERQRLLALINNMGDAVIAIDTSGKIMLYNAAFLNLIDTNANLEGQEMAKILKLHDENNRPKNLNKILEKNPTGFTRTDLVHNFSKDDALNLYINASPIRLSYREGSFQSGFILILRDITKEKSLDEERDEFISVVSHELRTPVAIAEGDISNAMFFSDKNHDPKVVSAALEQAHNQVIFLADMINDLATLSRAERTDYKSELEDIDIPALMEEFRHEYSPQAEAKKLKFMATANNDVKTIYTSRLYLHEILQNFITNAIKYTKSGSVSVKVSFDTHENMTVFEVTDTGIGLSKSDQDHVFEKFWRSEDYRTRESSGTGLGLYVTQKLAQKINAKLSLKSQLNKGTTFSISVPAADKPK